MTTEEIFETLGLESSNSGVFAGEWLKASGETVDVVNPTTGESLATATLASLDDYDRVVASSVETFELWRQLPAPKRGDYIRRLGNALRENIDALGGLVTLEMGKILPEGVGEVQEMVDICDFAVGLSRQLYGNTMTSERPSHRMYEHWHPLGPVGVISAFNFPVAVWSWNAAIAAVCGDTVVWKPSERTPLTAIAVTKIAQKVMAGSGFEGVFNLAVGDGATVGNAMNHDTRVPLVSATGSCAMGRIVGPAVAQRMGRSILELGGNNALIVMDDADLDLAVRGTLFSAVGTSGQRCTSLRRLLVHRAVADKMVSRLVESYQQITVGDPLDESTLMGPVVSEAAIGQMMNALDIAREQGGRVVTGGNRVDRPGYFVEPTIVIVPKDASITQDETFAPILWVIEFDTLAEAIEIQNHVTQGLSSAIFTESLKNSERFLSDTGSDCGIANVNIGTSGAEIGGAFGGEKETGGGREAGSDAWKAYMRRQTTTINWGDDLPLAQGIEFG
ncbi:MAG: aldehyde dehydrogenase family protein [Acidobacteria bacterium]|nr:aldehyde dehydrogenase family protein [Acidobacteriota bacterium]TDI36834.1 MAG: aldehyde dehydrogenase family protein [Acidobacteriota bacterium]TDI49129.1 MAG: aldehyde dehydrogenase family protein [Acidobacteriota bacterium]TDI49577.1 MAG: aldehyde dehydrogenase family protein [Acidobacteriota bacterium]TDI57335.1 MAG: aldehyde dehydrogenase family protein [Acidobacteriota bacterium]